MLNLRFIRRQLTATKQQSAIFVVCVALSMVSLVALRGLGDSINRALLTDARETGKLPSNSHGSADIECLALFPQYRIRVPRHSGP